MKEDHRSYRRNFCRTDTYEDFLRRANLPPLYNRRLQEIVILMYKVRNGLDPIQYVVLGPDEKDVNEYFLSWKRSSELKFVL